VPIILSVRLPRVLCVALTGAALSICGGAMQGLLKNPLADGSTLGVASGASLGAVVAIAFGITIPAIPFAGTMVLAIVFAFLSLLIILSLAYKIDYSMSTNTIILIGVIYSMFVSSILALSLPLLPTMKQITFWTIGSLGATCKNALVLLGALVEFGGLILRYARELQRLCHQRENSRQIVVPVRGSNSFILIAVSALIAIAFQRPDLVFFGL
jgi:iron complex transport system permease protein